MCRNTQWFKTIVWWNKPQNHTDLKKVQRKRRCIYFVSQITLRFGFLQSTNFKKHENKILVTRMSFSQTYYMWYESTFHTWRILFHEEFSLFDFLKWLIGLKKTGVSIKDPMKYKKEDVNSVENHHASDTDWTYQKLFKFGTVDLSNGEKKAFLMLPPVLKIWKFQHAFLMLPSVLKRWKFQRMMWCKKMNLPHLITLSSSHFVWKE